MGPLGIPELIFILLLALLIFGPRKLPEIGRTLGKAMGEFRRATNDLKRTIDTEAAFEDERQSRARTPQAAPEPGAKPSAEATENGDEEGAGDGAVGDRASAEPAAASPRGTEPRGTTEPS